VLTNHLLLLARAVPAARVPARSPSVAVLPVSRVVPRVLPDRAPLLPAVSPALAVVATPSTRARPVLTAPLLPPPLPLLPSPLA